MKQILLPLFLFACLVEAHSQASIGNAANASGAQESLLETSKEIHAQLTDLRDEMTVFLPERAGELAASGEKLQNLLRGEMANAAQRLRAASVASDASTRQTALNQAHRDQSTVENALDSIWSEMGGSPNPDRIASKALAEAVKTIREIARRQSVVGMETKRLSSNPDKGHLQRLAGEQQHFAIVAEQLASKLEGNEQARSLADQAKVASKAMQQGDFDSASIGQQKVLRAMQDLAKTLDPEQGEPDLDRLRQLKREFDGVANMQNDAARHLAAGNMKSASEEQDRAAMVAASLAPAIEECSPAARDSLQQALATMEKAADAIARGDQSDASKFSASTSELLADVAKEMGKQIAGMDSSSSPAAKAQAAQKIGQSAKATPGSGGDPQKPSGNGGPPGSGMGGGLGKSAGDLKSSGKSAETAQTISRLDPAERAAAAQLQAVKPPPEFSEDVGQYFKNLADGVSPIAPSQP